MAKKKTKKVKQEKEVLPSVEEIIAPCPKCGNRGYTTRTSRVDERGVMMVDGKIVTGVRYRYVTCDNCPQRFVIRSPKNNENN